MSDYLWDRSGPVDPEVAGLEARLKPLAFDAAANPLRLPEAAGPTVVTIKWLPRFPRRRLVWMVPAGAIAASLLMAAGLAAWHSWRLDWQIDRAWAVNGGRSTLAVGGTLDVQSAPADVTIARLGVLRATPGTSLGLNGTGPTRHRLTLNRGEIDVRVWAPPGRVAVHTPAGDVIDMGCIFKLSVDDEGVARLSVQTGWVNLTNAFGTSFIPAGASGEMRAGVEPFVPVYDDAPEEFNRAVRALETAGESPDPSLLRSITLLARKRDALTLLMLSDRDGMTAPVRSAILERFQMLQPPPEGITIARVLGGDRDAFWKWRDALKLPPLKNWWANWRDVFPR